MSNKVIIYTSNPDFKPKKLQDVIDFAKAKNKFRICEVGLNAHLANVKAGDQITTGKGNHIYVIKTLSTTVEDATAEERSYVDNLARNYDLKKVNITSVASIIKYESWSKFAAPLCKSSKETTTMTKNSLANIGDRMREMFIPTEADNVRLTVDGKLVVSTARGYVAITDDNQLVSYPEEFTVEMPVFVMCKPVAQLKVGDVIALDKSYAKVVKINGSKLSCISYTGSGKTVHTIKDILFNQTMVRVVVSLAGTVDGATNPMLLMALAGKGDNDNLLPLLMMQQNGGNVAANPMMMAMLMKKGGDLSDLLMMSAMTGGANPFAGMFGAPVAPAAPETPAAPVSVVPGAVVEEVDVNPIVNDAE